VTKVAKRSRRRAEGLGPPLPRTSPPNVMMGGAAERSRRRLILGSGLGLLAVGGVAIGVALSGGSSSPGQAAVRTIPWTRIPGLQSGPPPWNNSSARLPNRLSSAGLHALPMEGAAVHIHDHLDVFVHGKRVIVPALIGVSVADNFYTELHTHDKTGIIHIESPTKTTFTLGQFFCEWGVKLTANALGPYREPVSCWVNGRRISGDPAHLILRPHQEVVVAVGSAPQVAASYDFPPGL
jgi:hypothetical protein